MANENNNKRGSIYSANDTLDINELASLNDDISTEFIEQLQNQVAINASDFIGNTSSQQDDSELFEEVAQPTEKPLENEVQESNLEDDFAKKFNARKRNESFPTPENTSENIQASEETGNTTNEQNIANEVTPVAEAVQEVPQNAEIENLTSGNIVEKPISQKQVEYNESLDFVDENIKYSKYVIYVDPENKEFIESLTVKERKNLINRILREQDDIAITKKRLSLVQTIIKHAIIAVITISISIPIIYLTINASLEASINNYKRSQTIFKTLYREKGKIQKQSKY